MKKTILILISLCLLCSCGDSSSGLAPARVVDISVVKANLQVGEGTVFGVDFAFDVDDVADGGNVVVTVMIPHGLQLRSNTSEIDNSFGDKAVGAQIFTCGLGAESYLVYDLDRFDLRDASDPRGDADARLKFTLDAIFPVGFAMVQARADSSLPAFGCDLPFLFDDQIAVTIQ